MLGVDRRTGSAAQGSSFRLPAEISLCIACLLCRWDQKFQLTLAVQWHSLSPVATAMPAADRQRSCGDTLFTQICKTKLLSEDLGIVSLQTVRSFGLLFDSAHKVIATCQAYRAWTSFCRPLEERIHFLSLFMLLAAFCPYKGLACGHTYSGDSF